MKLTPLRMVVAAFAASAALVVLQTIVFQLLAWDSPAFGKVSVAFRIAFCAADVAVLAAFLSLRQAKPALRGLSSIGAALTAFAVTAQVAGLGASALGSDAVAIRALAQTMGGAEPIASLAASLLMMLTLGALEPRRRGLSTLVVLVSIAMSLGFRIARIIDGGARSLPAAWISWLAEVARPVAIAAFAWGIARAFAKAGTSAKGAAAGPYRAAGEGPIAPATLEAPGPDTVTSVLAAASALSFYRSAFLSRIACAVISTFLLVVGAAQVRDGRAVIFFSLVPFLSLFTALALAWALVRLLALPRAAGARGATIGGLVAISLAGLVDGGTLLASIGSLATSSSYRAWDITSMLFAIGWPFTTLCAGVSLLLVAEALASTVEKLGAPSVATSARWTQGFAIACGAAQIGCVFSTFVLESERAHYPRSDAGWFVIAFLVFAAGASMVTVFVLHAGLVGKARNVLLAYAEGDDMPS